MLANYPNVRIGLYVASVALSAIGIIVMVASQEWGAAILSAAGTFSIAAGATAVNNVAAPKK